MKIVINKADMRIILRDLRYSALSRSQRRQNFVNYVAKDAAMIAEFDAKIAEAKLLYQQLKEHTRVEFNDEDESI